MLVKDKIHCQGINCLDSLTSQCRMHESTDYCTPDQRLADSPQADSRIQQGNLVTRARYRVYFGLNW